MRSLLTTCLSAICAGPVIASGLAEEWTLADDCSFVGLDWGAPAPSAEGNELLSAIIAFETFDDAPLPFSELVVFDCGAAAGVKASWDSASVAQDITEQLRSGPIQFEAWKSGIAAAGQAKMVGVEVAYGTMACACELHYGIKVDQ